MSNRLNPNMSKTKYFKPSGSGRKMIPCTEAENEEHRARCAVQAHLFKTIQILCDMGYEEISRLDLSNFSDICDALKLCRDPTSPVEIELLFYSC